MIETSLYRVRVTLSFDKDPLEQILLQTESEAIFNSLESEFEISGFCSRWPTEADETVYFNIENLSFGCIDNLRNGIAMAIIEASFPVDNDFVYKLISKYISHNNNSFRLIHGDAGPIDIQFTNFGIER